MGNGFVGWFERSYKGIIIALLAIMAVTLVVLAVQHVDASRAAAGATPRPIPTYGSASPVDVTSIPKNANVLIVGDSYTEGYGATDEASRGWAPLLAVREGWKVTIDGVGGTGYTNGGQPDGTGDKAFSARISERSGSDPDLVIIQGGQNDWRPSATDLTDAAKNTLTDVRRQWPEAVVIAIGPSAPQPAGDSYSPQSTAIQAAARTLDVPFISPVASHWFTAKNSPDYAYSDGQHLNDAGHEYLASRVEDALTRYVVVEN